MGFSDKNLWSLNYIRTDFRFREINNVVVNNDLNSDDGEKIGDVDTNYPTSETLALHLSIPFWNKGPRLGLSMMAPVDHLGEINSGDPYRPEYVMYQSRLQRPSFFLNLIYRIQDFSFSLGGHSGLRTEGETNFMARTSGDTTPSSGTVRFKAQPKWSPITSLSYSYNTNLFFTFSFQNELKSSFETRAIGVTPVGGGSFPFDLTISSLMYYDPRIYRLGSLYTRNQHVFNFTLEYQEWGNYHSPKLNLDNNGGVIIGGQNFEELSLKNILIPRIGWRYELSDSWNIKSGYFYRESPIRSSSYEKGNSLDASVHALSMGVGKKITLQQQELEWDFSFQFQQLQSRKILKTDQMEDGSNGRKIGAPGYRTGGQILVFGLGLSWET